jgi:hypothetical protein
LTENLAIYRIANGVIERVTVPLPSGINPQPFHWYSLGNPQVSADGRAFSYTSKSFLKVDGQTDQALAGEAQISRRIRPLSMIWAPGSFTRHGRVRRPICALLRSRPAAMSCSPADRRNIRIPRYGIHPSATPPPPFSTWSRPNPASPPKSGPIHPDGTGRRQLTNFLQDVSEAVISGNGQTAIAATNGRLVSIDIATGAVRELIPTTPICYPGIQMSGYGRLSLAPGSLFSIIGTALAASTQAASAPLPTELAGTQVLMNGTPLPLLSVSPTEVWFQVPFEAPPGTIATLTIDYGSPFGGCSVVLPISGRGPAFFWDNGGNVISIHQGFTGLVTRQSHCCLEVGFS